MKPIQESSKTSCRPLSAHEPALEVPHSLPISLTQSSCKMTGGIWSMSLEEQNKTWLVAHKGNEVSHLFTASLKTNQGREGRGNLSYSFKIPKVCSYCPNPIKSYIPLKSLPTHIPFKELGVCNCHKRGIVNLQVTVTSQTYPTPE